MRTLDVEFHAVPIAGKVSVEEFLQEYVLNRKPVLIRNALNEWKALQWTPEYLKQAAGSTTLRYRTENGVKQGNFGELIDLIFNSDRPAPYLRNVDLRTQLPALARDIEPLPPYCAGNWRNHLLMTPWWPAEVRRDLYEVFVSRKDAVFPYLHIDYWGISAFLAQVRGSKEVLLFPAEDTPYLYPTSANPLKSSIRDFNNPNDPAFPAFRRARQHRVTLGPGDLLFNPGWWHTTRTVETSITVIWGYWNRHEWEDLIHHVQTRMSRKYRVALVPYLRFVGMCCRRGL